MDQAAELGSPYIVASPPQEVVDLGRATDGSPSCSSIGKRIGVIPSMEFLGFVDGIKNVASAWAIASGTGDPRATVVADVFHMIRGGGSVDDLLQLPGDRLACFHINDVPAEPDPLTQTDEDRVMVGEGIADLPRVIANLRTIGYRGPLSLELFNRELWARTRVEVVRLRASSEIRGALVEATDGAAGRSILGQVLGIGLAADLSWSRSAAPSSIILSSLPTAMNCQPSRARRKASAAVRTCRPQGGGCAGRPRGCA